MRKRATTNMKASTTICITLVAAVAMIYVMLQYIGVDIGECLVRSPHDGGEPLIIAVLGGGAQGVINENSPPPKHTIIRLDRALDLCRESSSGGNGWKSNCIIIPLSYGTTHKPPPQDTLKYPLTECSISSRYLLSKGFPASQIREENISLDTVGNAYFLRAIHIIPMSYMQRERMQMVVITNDWHMPRTKAIFEVVFNLPMDTVDTINSSKCLQITYEAVDSGLSKEDHASRLERETKSITSWIATSSGDHAKFHTFRELSTWLFTVHNAYAVTRFSKSRDALFEVLDEKTLKSY